MKDPVKTPSESCNFSSEQEDLTAMAQDHSRYKFKHADNFTKHAHKRKLISLAHAIEGGSMLVDV